MNFEVLKNISEYFYIDFKDIIDGIVSQNENIYNKFRIATEELLSQINNKHHFVKEGMSFYNRIINDDVFLDYMLNEYKCDPKLMRCLHEIQKKGNDTTHNSLKVFDEKDVKETIFRILVLAKKVLKFERNIDDFKITTRDVYNEVERLLTLKNTDDSCSKDNFVEKIKELEKQMSLEYPKIYDGEDEKNKIIDDFKEIISIIANYLIKINPKYNSLEDLKIGNYSEIYKAYNHIESIKHYDDIENVIASLNDYSYVIKTIMSNSFNIDIFDWILDFSKKNNENEEDIYSDYREIARAIDESSRSFDETYDVNGAVYYVENQRQFVVDNELYYTVYLKKAINDNAKSSTVYSKRKLPDNYALEISLSKKEVELLGNKNSIFVIKDYKVAIRPCEIKWLICALTGEKEDVVKSSSFYRTFMNYLQLNKCTLLDILTANEKIYNEFLSTFDGITARIVPLFKEAMNKARDIILKDEFDSGANILRYFTSKLNNNVLRDQIFIRNPEEWKNMYFKKGSYRFDKNPFSFSLCKHNLALKDLYKCIDVNNYQEDILVKKMCNKMVEQQTLFVDGSLFGNDTAEMVDRYNKYIDLNYDKSGKIGVINNYYYSYDNIQVMNYIIDRIGDDSKILCDDYYKNTFNEVINSGLDSEEKINILKNAFNNSGVTFILGEAGSGKTELLCNYFVNIFKGKNILFVSNTHTCLNNMKRRVRDKSGIIEDLYEFKTVKGICNGYEYNEYDVVIIDECKSISNRDIKELLRRVKSTYYIYGGDVGQIDAIDLGNWFDVVTQLIDSKNVFELKDNHRSNSDDLKKIWKKVRNREEDTLNYLLDNNYIEMVSDDIFKKVSDSEIILCLNYNGTYGITSINNYFQNENENPLFRNNLDSYKVGDQVIFNENANNNKYKGYLYNNLTGIIRNIKENGEYLEFDIKVDTYIPSDISYVISSNSEENYSIVHIEFKKYSDKPDDNNEEDYVCPFTVSYALSIHKAQGLEFDSVKIIITPESEELINNRVFYTAITRAKQHLKIYLTKNNQENMINILTEKDDRKDVELIKLIREN